MAAVRALALALLVAGCGGSADPQNLLDAPTQIDAVPDAFAFVTPVANPAREIVDTQLALDVTAHTGTATITLGASSTPGASLEAQGLTITSVTLGGADVPYQVFAHTMLLLGLPPSPEPLTVAVTYRYQLHGNYDGQSSRGSTVLWPYYCGNLYPCHSQPEDGTTFHLALTGIPDGEQAVYPTAIPAEAPAYQVAFAVGSYTELPLGTTTAGTQLSVWYRPGEEVDARAGTAHLVAAFDWLEQTIGPYRFGPKAGSVSVDWGTGLAGGMEHHPFWHIGGALADEEVNVHESAHGWYGDGIRIKCWEDFVLSEGTTNYLDARALSVVAPTVGAAIWAQYEQALAALPGTQQVWPQSCGVVDVKSQLFTNAPYLRGAFFYRALALKLGDAAVDNVLHAFYLQHAGRAASMADMLQTIHDVTGYDPTTCAATWLTSTTRPTVAPCP